MKKIQHSIRNYLAAQLLPAFLFVAVDCSVKEVPNEGYQEKALTPANVALSLAVSAELDGTPGTKAIDDPSPASLTEIHNLNILQFRGTDENATLVGEVHFLRDDVDPSADNYLNLNKIRLADSDGETHTVVILANLFTQLPRVQDLGMLKEMYRTISTQTEVFGYTGSGAGFPDDTGYYQRLNALATGVISNGAVLTATLRRSIARINVSISNTGADGLVIQKVQLCNVPERDWYITDYRYNGTSSLLFGEYNFHDTYIVTDPARMDYPALDWTGTGGTPGVGTGAEAAHYQWYMPCNQRGVADPRNTIPSEKNRCLNVNGATYVYIQALYGPSHDKPILYKFYLGGNLTDDFDINPNTAYTYTFSFNGKGEPTTDFRIQDFGSIDFTVDANCFILNPSDFNERKYTFNVVHRPNIFWGSPAGDRYGIFYLHPNNYIGTAETWKAQILWSDIDMTQEEALAFLSRRTGNGGGTYEDDCQRVQITVPAGMQEGNVVIGVWTDAPENILWSWHLWITRYQPDDIIGHKPDNDTFIYSVTGGEVHRYNGSTWMATSDGHQVPSGRYANGYSMDRSIGAFDTMYHATSMKGGGMYYQYGRKDPFPAAYRLYCYTYDGVRSTTASGIDNIDHVPANSDIIGTGGPNVPFSVNHPRTFFTSAASDNRVWTYNDVFNPAWSTLPVYISELGRSVTTSQIVWQDPCNTDRLDNEELGGNASKSIFDPCPPGWRVPNNSAWNNMTNDPNKANTSTTRTNVNIVFGVRDDKTHSYYPRGYLYDKSNPNAPVIYFPHTGRRSHWGGVNEYGMSNGGNLYFDHAQSQQSGVISYCDGIEYFITSYSFPSKTLGGQVRCLREDYTSRGYE